MPFHELKITFLNRRRFRFKPRSRPRPPSPSPIPLRFTIPYRKMEDPDCAICSQPAIAQCECEAKGLTVAIRHAEQRMMTSVFNEIRTWVRTHAQDYILDYFRVLKTRRKESHAAHIHRITDMAAYYYNARPHPSEISAADAELKRGIDEDWRASVQRYPEVLEYFYSLVELNLPGDDEPGVRDPPLSALGGVRKVRVREPDVQGGRRRVVGGAAERVRRQSVPAPMQRERERVERRGTPGPPPFAPMPSGYQYVTPGY
ncbi:hypothetical protein B7494_g140 [Chlorociboria aeruginascens]|nr:hypothetical protein B7494_g140 [Chlorociboria aeruginascens]